MPFSFPQGANIAAMFAELDAKKGGVLHILVGFREKGRVCWRRYHQVWPGIHQLPGGGIFVASD
jgi:hypothetical protein